ncbi:MAG: preprotein translocase subunit SecA [Planctomycetia bacterium]|nr:preprotein translocase subunit SecA [Planctomycetia bacterium]
MASTSNQPAAPRQDDSSLWEKIGDGFTAMTEGVNGLLSKMFGSSNERAVRNLGFIRLKDQDPPYRIAPGSVLARINELEPKMRELSDEGLKALTPAFRARLAKGETLDDILPEAFAACREAGRRFKNMRHFDVQMLGGIALHQGKIAEMVTGEGKTLVATAPAYLNALTGQGVHVITVNDYLARRDCEWMTPIYQGLGITAGFIQTDIDPEGRRNAYDCDITYGTNSEFGFDYLRDNMKPARWGDNRFNKYQQQCQKALNYAIIDEVDNILIDEARTPLIISGSAHGNVERFKQADRVARQLKKDVHFEVKEKERTCHLTEEGIHYAEKLAGVESFYTAGNMHWPHLLDQALKAHHLYHRDKEYMVAPSQEPHERGRPIVVIIDEFTGRAMFGRQWSDGLHQAVEAKENVPIKEETQTLATVTLQNFFKLYKKLAGMTGTAMTEANEFWKIYKLDVLAVPTNRAMKRKNYPDVVFRTEKEKWNAILEEIVDVHASGQPILVGTTDVAKSEELSVMLKRRGIKHELLNAKPEFVAKESEIVAQAGRQGSVTIATNMAGRGTDIILGGNAEYMAWNELRHEYQTRLDVPVDVWKAKVDEVEAREKTKEEGRKVAELGGLHVIGTERHESRRIDNQLRGRSGRQGDPGSSRFYVSLQDELMRIFMGEWVANVLTRLGMKEGESIESKMVSRRIEAAQKKVEERNFDIRKNLLEYDEVMDYQRKRIYGFRQKILDGANCKLIIQEMLQDTVSKNVDRFLGDRYGTEAFTRFVGNRLNCEYDPSEFVRMPFSEAETNAKNKACMKAVNAIQDALEENMDPTIEDSEWNWEAFAKFMDAKFGVKTSVRELKQIGRDKIMEELLPRAEKNIEAIDIREGAPMLAEDYGLSAIANWFRLKFNLTVNIDELRDKSGATVKALLNEKVKQLYTEKEVEFPVKVLMHHFLGRDMYGQQRFDPHGLLAMAKERFAGGTAGIADPEFVIATKDNIEKMLIDTSRKAYPADGADRIEAELDKHFGSATKLSEESARELAAWANQSLKLQVEVNELAGFKEDHVRQVLYCAFDNVYRPEMMSMERSLVLNVVDSSWKDHLYSMDYLRSAISFVGYAQQDPKTTYKREGMRAFDEMWEGDPNAEFQEKESIRDKITDLIFRMEEAIQDTSEAVLSSAQTRHDAASRPLPPEGSIRAQQDEAIANSQQGAGKPEPARNKGPRVGRNDPCPCGSGKKYKQCHMKKDIG